MRSGLFEQGRSWGRYEILTENLTDILRHFGVFDGYFRQVSQQIEYLVALRDANPEYKAQARRRQQAAQLAALGADQAEAEKAMAETGDFCVAASVLGIQNEVGRFVRSPVGLPNRSNDCFWLSTVQCLRHLPGFAQAVTGSVESALLRPPRNVAHALANLFLRMERQHEEQCLPLRDRSEFLTGIEPN